MSVGIDRGGARRVGDLEEPSEGEIERLPEGMTLIPGMPVEAYFGTDARTPFEYLLKPFIDYFTKAFRES